MTADESASPIPAPLTRRLVAEFVGAALLVAIVVGSGTAASKLSPGDIGLQLLQNSLATTLGLAVLIAVTLADWWLSRRSGREKTAVAKR